MAADNPKQPVSDSFPDSVPIETADTVGPEEQPMDLLMTDEESRAQILERESAGMPPAKSAKITQRTADGVPTAQEIVDVLKDVMLNEGQEQPTTGANGADLTGTTQTIDPSEKPVEIVPDEDYCEKLLRRTQRNCNQIEEHVFLGSLSAAENGILREEFKIKRILSLLNWKPTRIAELDIPCCFIFVDDFYDEDMLSHFPDIYAFINDAVENKESVLVHCAAGVSRSATAVISYHMKKHGKSVDEASHYVMSRRPQISPNPGFVRQLKLYHRWNYEVNAANPEYRRYLVSMLNRTGQYGEYFDDNSVDKYFVKMEKAELIKSPPKGRNYCCARCKTILFNEVNVLQPNGSNDSEASKCSFLYIELMHWFREQIRKLALQGEQFQCPNCCSAVGSLNDISSIDKCCDYHSAMQRSLFFKIEKEKVLPLD